MGKLLVVIAIVAGVAYAWHQGWIARWFNTAVDSSLENVSKTRQEARKVRPVDAPSEEKK